MLSKVRNAFQNLRRIPELKDEVSNLKDVQSQNLSNSAASADKLHRRLDDIDKKIDAITIDRPIEGPATNNVITDSSITFDYEYKPAFRDLTSGKHGKAILSIMDANNEGYRSHLREILKMREQLNAIPTTGSPDDLEPYWKNSWFESLDGISLYYFLKKNNPATYMEVGSGNSTKFARKSIQDNGLRTKIVSIDPYPRANIDDLCDEVIRHRCEDVDTKLFSRLKPDDVLLIDNSHRSFQGSDVTVFFTEIQPSLEKGVLFGVHDIFLPYDYPDRWKGRFYNEQYLLLAYLLGGGGGGRIEFPVRYLAKNGLADEILGDHFLDSAHLYGAAFWMTK